MENMEKLYRQVSNLSLLRKSGIIAAIVTCTLLGAWFGFSKLSLGAYNEKNLTWQFLGEDSKVFKTIVIEVGTDAKARIIVGTTSMTFTGTATYPGQPRIEYDGATGQWSFKNSGGTETVAFGTVSAGYVAAEIGSTAANYVLRNNGSSTGQVATNPTLAGVGTITATFSANGLDITPAEYASVNNATGELQAQINTKQATLGYVPLSNNIGSVSTALGSQSIDALLDVNIVSPADQHRLTYDLASGKWISATASVSIGFSGVTGLPQDNSELAKLLGADKLLLPGTTTPFSGTSTSGTLYNLIRTKRWTKIDANSVLAIECNNVGSTTFKDSSSNNYTITSNGNAIGSSTTIRAGGAGTGWLDGDVDCLTVADNAGMPNGTNPFSIEQTFRLDAITGQIEFCGQVGDASTGNSWKWFYENATNRISIESVIGGANSIYIYGTHTLAVGTTYTICVDRNGTTVNDWKIFVNGESKALTFEGSSASGTMYAATVDLKIGAGTDSARELSGLIDDFHLSNVSRHQSNYTPTAINANYTYSTMQIIPPGTSAAFLNIVNNGTYSETTEMCLGTTTPFSSGTVHIVQGVLASRTLFGSYDSYCFEESKDIIGTGTSVQEEAYSIAKRVNIVKSHPIDPKKKVTQDEAVFAAQESYLNLFKESDIITYKTDHTAEYIITLAGSTSVNLTKLNSDAQAYHENLRKVEFEVLPDRNERIRTKKKAMESNKNITSISIVADDASTDDLLKGADKRTANLNNGIGVLFGAFQKQVEEIGSLTAALENQKIAYNEEIDNLYKLIDKIIVALLAIGGVSGWATIRTKRKGT